MRTVLVAAAVVGVCAAGVPLALRDDGSAPRSPAAQAPSADVEPPSGSAAPDHEDDYGDPWYVLIDHIDHLDRARIPPDTLRQIDAELDRRQGVADRLWAAYAPVLAGDAGPVDDAARALDAAELGYVLLTARADQLAAATAASGSLEAAVAATGPDADDVAVTLVGDCVTVTWAGDPFARAFGARAGPPPPADDAVERIERTVRVAAAGEPACAGAPVAYSPQARAVLAG